MAAPIVPVQTDALLAGGASSHALGDDMAAREAAPVPAEAPALEAAAGVPSGPTPSGVDPYAELLSKDFDLFAPGAKEPSFRSPLSTILAERARYADHLVNVVAPTGESGTVPLGMLDDAVAKGFKPQTAVEAHAQRFVDENKGLKGDVKAAITNFADELFLGVPGVVMAHTEDDYHRAAWEALRKEHEFANVAGGVAGFGGSLLVGGPVFKGAAVAGELAERAAARALGARLASAGVEEGAKAAGRAMARSAVMTAAQLGAEGAVIAAPKAITEAMVGDPDAAGETLMMGLGGGAALGFVGGAAGQLLKRLPFEAAASAAEGLVSADKSAFKSLDPIQTYTRQIINNYGADGLAVVGKRLNELGLARRVGEDAASVFSRLESKQEELTTEIGSLYTNLDEKLAAEGKPTGVRPEQIAERLREQVLKPLTGQVGREGVVAKVEKYIESFEGHKIAFELEGSQVAPEAPNLGFKELHDVRKLLDEDIFGLAADVKFTPQKKALMEARQIISEELEHGGSEAARRVGDVGWLGRLKRANEDFGMVKLATDASRRSAVGEASNRGFSLTDYLAGSAGKVAGATVGGFVGGAPGALLGGHIGGVVDATANRWLRKNWHPLIAKYGDKAGILVSEQGMRLAGEQLARVPEVLERLGASKEAIATVPSHAISRFLGSAADDHRTREDDFTKLSTALADFHANPARASQMVDGLVGPVHDGGAPDIAAAYGRTQLAALDYLYTTMPRATSPAAPFASGPAWKPTRSQILGWERRIEVVRDPFAVFRHLEQRTLMAEHVETLARIYPKLHAAIVGRVARVASSPKAPKLSMSARAQLELLMGRGTGGRGAAGAARYQQAFASANAKKAPPPSAAAGITPQAPTDVQRLSG